MKNEIIIKIIIKKGRKDTRVDVRRKKKTNNIVFTAITCLPPSPLVTTTPARDYRSSTYARYIVISGRGRDPLTSLRPPPVAPDRRGANEITRRGARDGVLSVFVYGAEDHAKQTVKFLSFFRNPNPTNELFVKLDSHRSFVFDVPDDETPTVQCRSKRIGPLGFENSRVCFFFDR